MSTAKLKPLEKQVIVITDAASDIGRATALLAAGRGAKVVVSARNEEAGSKIAEEINAGGGETVHIPCNMADRGQVEELVATALDRFGYIDTWINTSELAICSRLDEISEEDSRRLFDANFWGIYHGSLAILPHLKRYGGALINLGSEISESVVPCQGIYSAAKYAVKGFVDTLRLEVEELEHAPVSITLIQPPLSPKSLPA